MPPLFFRRCLLMSNSMGGRRKFLGTTSSSSGLGVTDVVTSNAVGRDSVAACTAAEVGPLGNEGRRGSRLGRASTSFRSAGGLSRPRPLRFLSSKRCRPAAPNPLLLAAEDLGQRTFGEAAGFVRHYRTALVVGLCVPLDSRMR